MHHIKSTAMFHVTACKLTADVLLQDATLLRRPTMLRKLASRAFSSMTTL